jgi:response regulator RpfG family c-di-GMP phosphodiesterase
VRILDPGNACAHASIIRIASKRPLLDASTLSQASVKTLRKSQFVVRNLFEERTDVSAISKKVIFQMNQYPDGSGYPLPESEEFRPVPEFARMASIADDYDELVNPVLHPHPMGRTESLGFLAERSGES